MSDWHIVSLTLLCMATGFIIYAIWQDFPPRRDK
jgi:hypothetical protein